MNRGANGEAGIESVVGMRPLPPKQLKHLKSSRLEAGQSALELALLLPVLLLMVCGIIDLGRLAFTCVAVNNAARAGVQYGAQNLTMAADSAGMVTAAKNEAQGINGFSATATHFCQCLDGSASTCAAGDCKTSRRLLFVQTNTTAQFQTFLNYSIIPSSITLNGQAVMRVSE